MEVTSAAIPYRVLTVDEADAFLQRLQAAADTLFRSSDSGLADILKEHLLETEYRHIMEYTAAQKLDITSQSALQEFVQQLSDRINELPLIVLQLAFRPRYQFVARLVDWLEHYGPGSGRLKIVFNPDIIGGLVLEYNGRIHDSSLRKNYEHLPAVS